MRARSYVAGLRGYPCGMAERLTRWQFARRHTDPRWIWRVLAGFISGGLFLVASRRYGWNTPVSPLIGGAIIACLTAFIVLALEFVTHLSRAGIVQDREELAQFREAAIDLKVGVHFQGIQYEHGGPLHKETGEVDDSWSKVWLREVRITNRSHDHAVSLSFDLHAQFGDETFSLGFYRCMEEDNRRFKCFPIPLNIRPESSEVGGLGFFALGAVEAWKGGEYLLTLVDHISGKSLTVRVR